MHQTDGIPIDVLSSSSNHANVLLLTFSLAKIYKRLEARLVAAGFARDQYSDWVHPFIDPAHVYNIMTGLENIPPPNKLSSTVRRLRMNRVDPLVALDISESIALGGNFSTTLRGPVPVNLVLPVAGAIVPIPGPIPPGAPFALPVDSRPGGASNPANFLM